MKKKTMEQLRREIDKLDHQVIDLLNQRALLVIEMGKCKLKKGWKLFDPKREKKVLSNVISENTGPLSSDAIIRIYERIIDESRRLERIEVYNKKRS
ncbi:MAG: chorismate mutase [FCB group bacterium]|nr:chorismate mutase [FCB group bacterium]